MGIKGTPAGDHDPYRGGKKGLKKKLIFTTKNGFAIATSQITLFWYCLEFVFLNISYIHLHQNIFTATI